MEGWRDWALDFGFWTLDCLEGVLGIKIERAERGISLRVNLGGFRVAWIFGRVEGFGFSLCGLMMLVRDNFNW